jgi:hypothetical protein
VKEPVVGRYVAISPSAHIVQYTKHPASEYASRMEAGPPNNCQAQSQRFVLGAVFDFTIVSPFARAVPVPRKRPVPMVPAAKKRRRLVKSRVGFVE